jgi:hypothetical protein
MTPRQWNLVDKFTANDKYVLVECDKNRVGTILNHPGMDHLNSDIEVIASKQKEKTNPAGYSFLHKAISKYKGKLAIICISLKTHKTPW